MENNKIEFTGKIAKFPKNTKAINALKLLEKIKVNPNKLQYVIIENQDNELKMVKYNKYKGVNLNQYVTTLKDIYLDKYKNDISLFDSINAIEVSGENEYSIIKNIPNIIIENKTLLSKITSDLIKLLAE